MKQGAVQRWPVLVVIGSLLCLWLGLVAFGWARWGSVTIDSGREIYVAAALAEGRRCTATYGIRIFRARRT